MLKASEIVEKYYYERNGDSGLLQIIAREFDGLSEEEQKLLLAQKIVINEKIAQYFLRYLAIVAIYGGENCSNEEKNQRLIYQNQGILPKNLKFNKEERNFEKKINEVVAQLAPENLRNLCLRLYQKRVKAVVGGVNVANLLRENCAQVGNPAYDLPKDYIFESEIELGAQMNLFGYQKFRGNGARNKNQNPHAENGFASSTCGIKLTDPLIESYHFKSAPLPIAKRANGNFDIGKIMDVSLDFVKAYQHLYQSPALESWEANGFYPDLVKERVKVAYGQYFAGVLSALSGDKQAYVRIVGIGDGVWAAGQSDMIREQIGNAIKEIVDEFMPEQKAKIAAIEFLEFGHNKCSSVFGAQNYGGIDIISGQIDGRTGTPAPASPPIAKYQECVVFRNYAADSRSFIGNEFWQSPNANKIATDDPAFVYSSYAAIALNPEINPDLEVFVAKNYQLQNLQEEGVFADLQKSNNAQQETGIALREDEVGGSLISEENRQLMAENSRYLEFNAQAAKKGFTKNQVSAVFLVYSRILEGEAKEGVVEGDAKFLRDKYAAAFNCLKDKHGVEQFDSWCLFKDFSKFGVRGYADAAINSNFGLKEIDSSFQSEWEKREEGEAAPNPSSSPRQGFLSRLFGGSKNKVGAL